MVESETHKKIVEAAVVAAKKSNRIIIIGRKSNFTLLTLVSALENIEVAVRAAADSMNLFCEVAAEKYDFVIPDEGVDRYYGNSNSPTKQQRSEWRRSTMTIRK